MMILLFLLLLLLIVKLLLLPCPPNLVLQLLVLLPEPEPRPQSLEGLFVAGGEDGTETIHHKHLLLQPDLVKKNEEKNNPRDVMYRLDFNFLIFEKVR